MHLSGKLLLLADASDLQTSFQKSKNLKLILMTRKTGDKENLREVQDEIHLKENLKWILCNKFTKGM